MEILAIQTETGQVIATLQSPVIVPELGLIPSFIKDGDPIKNGFRDALETQYGFGTLYEMKGGSVSDTGIYSYPQDSDLEPLAKYETEKEICYQYHYGIISIVERATKTVFTTRMD